MEAAFALGEPAKIEDLLGLIESVPRGTRPPYLDAQAKRFRARLSGDSSGYEAAAAGFRELDLPFWLAVTLLEHAEWLAAEGRAEEAESHLGEARDILERLEAAPWLERVAAAAAEPKAHVPA